MSNRERIRTLNRTEDADGIRKFLERMETKFQMTYVEHRDFWKQCDPTIDNARFEVLMQMADCAGTR